jgi:Alpha-galactosidases/6-phospho-beta-glucosidases, family 4 of glycosyl hydrolases
MPKIVCLGAGSFSFGLSTLLTLLQSPLLRGSEIALVDINAESLDLTARLAGWLNESWDCGKHISAHSNHKDALQGADYVISAIEVQPRERLWQQDFELTLKYGLRQPYGENGGPGGFAHTARNVNTVLGIARDMEIACPDAWLINFTNPMHRLCYLVNQYSRIKVVGLCHQLAAGYAMAAKALAPIYGFNGADAFVSTHADPSNHYPMANMAAQGMERFKITAAGLNHFTWMLGLQDRLSGEDLYPLFRREWQKLPTTFEPLTRVILEIFKLFPIPGDEHLDEYLPWLSNPQQKAWKHYDLSLYNWALYEKLREEQWRQVSEWVSKRELTDSLKHPASEGAVELIESLVTGKPLYWEALNIPNRGLIDGLPPSAIVEVPGTISAEGITGEAVGELPRGISELLHREVSASQLCIDAVVHGDKDLALQSLLLDPVVDDINTARLILSDILETNKAWLPQFLN